MPPEPRVRQQKAAPHETRAAAACHHIRTYKVRAVPGFLQGKGCIEQADLRLLPPARDCPVAEAPCPALSRAEGLGTTRTQHRGHCPEATREAGITSQPALPLLCIPSSSALGLKHAAPPGPGCPQTGARRGRVRCREHHHAGTITATFVLSPKTVFKKSSGLFIWSNKIALKGKLISHWPTWFLSSPRRERFPHDAIHACVQCFKATLLCKRKTQGREQQMPNSSLAQPHCYRSHCSAAC